MKINSTKKINSSNTNIPPNDFNEIRFNISNNINDYIYDLMIKNDKKFIVNKNIKQSSIIDKITKNVTENP
jgi:hypothetical protein